MPKQLPRLLFVMPNLTSGGAEKSLVTLLRVLGERHDAGERFAVDLLLLEKQGLFLPQVPPWVRVLDFGETYKRFTGDWKRALPYFLPRGRLDLLLARVRYARAFHAPPGERPMRVWNALRYALPRLRHRYTAAIAYLEGNATWYCAEKVRAAHKLSFFHSDYQNFMAQYAMDKKSFAAFDTIVGVSSDCVRILQEIFPEYASRISCVENIVSPVLLRSLARQADPPWQPANTPAILTVARLDSCKGVDIAIRACALLRKAGVALRWYVLGGGDPFALQTLIAEQGVTDCFFLLGERENPYPALAACDLYVQPSRFEGKSIALEEAKALGKPIVTTRYGTVANQITDGVTGVLADISPEDLADKIKALLENAPLRQRLQENLHDIAGNEGEAAKFLQLLGADFQD
ncbi:MAG: glycosyltransferase [Oscillospiraceae bacterium]|jgi:glycosyltransferase involved in cell wall biosynthesis|nr:glycosyltransferase [Oscillospiraceae bacterium]